MDEKKMTETETSVPETVDAATAFEIVYHYKGIYRPITDEAVPAGEKTEEPAAPAEAGDIAYTDVYTGKPAEGIDSDAVIGTIAAAPAPAEKRSEFVYNQAFIKKNKRAAEAGRVSVRTRAFEIMSLLCGIGGIVAAVLLGFVGILLGVFALCFRSVARKQKDSTKNWIVLVGLITGLVAMVAGAGMVALRLL